MSDTGETAKGKDVRTESWLKKLGPGLITGAADDDPSGIATYSQAGAQFGFSMLWTVLLTYPLMVGIQMISAEIGRVSGHGLATNIRQHYCCAHTLDAGTDKYRVATLVMEAGIHHHRRRRIRNHH